MKNAFLIGVAAIAALVLMAWVVSIRTKGMPMPKEDMGGMPILLGQDLSKLTIDGKSSSGLPVLAEAMPEFTGIQEWMNSAPLTAEGLKGKVVLIDFWTYSCINCIRTLPYVTAWHDKYVDDGFTVIGVHTPEFAFEKLPKNVRAAIARHDITYPVALDNDYGTWNAYSNHYWPAHYLFDAKGRLRYTHFGEGKYDETEANIRALIAEAGEEAKDEMGTTASTVTPDFRKIGTPETYLGYGRMEGLASPEKVLRDETQTYSAPKIIASDRFAFVGSWRVGEERSMLMGAGGSVTNRYQASTANLVMGAQKLVVAEVTLDGAPVPESLRGPDVIERGGKTYVEVFDERLYGLIDARGDYAERTLKIRFERPGVFVYAFTFG